MLPISTKLTLMILVLPVLLILSVFGVGFYFYRESLDASAFATAVSSLLSAILVILLVWERLRDSLSKKLEYVHKNFLYKLYREFRRVNFLWAQDEIKKLKSSLERYGKFMILRLYPKNFMKKVDRFLFLHRQFYAGLEEIEELAKTRIPRSVLRRDILWYYIGWRPDELSSYTAEEEKQYKQIAQNIVEENPKLVSEAIEFLEETRRLSKQIFDELEDFLKSNNLRLKEE